MKRKTTFKKLFCIVIAVAIFALSIPFSAFAATGGEITFGVMSDLHYFAKANMGSDLDKFVEMSKLNHSTSYLSDAVLDSAFAVLAKEALLNDMKYILIPGDLTKNGELTGHQELSKRLRQFEELTGVEVLVINGNHDINNSEASKFTDGKWENDTVTTPEQFRSIYADFGYDLADSFYAPENGKAGGLSYAATLDGGYRVIALDGGVYSADATENGTDEHETRGNYTDGLMNWALNEIKKAKAEGLTVIGLAHHNLVPHFDCEQSIFEDFPIDDWQRVAETLADAGMHFAFTGHIHMNDVASHTSDNGETLTDIATTSLLSFPNNFRTVNFKTTNGKTEFTYKSHEIDEILPVSFNGTVYPKPFKNTSYGLNFGNGGAKELIMGILEYQLTYSFGADIKNAGGLYNFLVNNIDFDLLMADLMKSDLFGGMSSMAIKGILMTLCNQIQKTYLDDIPYTMSCLEPCLDKILNIEVSDYPCTKWESTYGFKSAGSKGTLGDVVSTALAYMYTNDENPDDDKFLMSALERFDNGENAETILNTLLTVLLDDLIQGTILRDLKIDPLSLGLNGATPELFETIINTVSGGNWSGLGLGDVISILFISGIVDGGSLSGLVYKYAGEYLTQSQYDTIDAELYRVIKDLTHDDNPKKQADMNGTIVYNGKVRVTPTVEDLRIPSGVAVTFGADSATQRNISYYTKYSLTRTDIQLVPYSNNPDFSKGTTVKANIKTSSKAVTRMYSAVDLGVIGIIDHEISVVRHTVQITGLKPGQKYSYRVGDASRGWWSEAGVIETADNGKEFSFFHMTDPQSVTEKQYNNNWASAVDTAFKNHKNSDFILATGDLVDSGKNFNHWQRMFNTASDELMDTAFMTATGNHEAKGENATVDNFLLSNIPEQDTTSGVYYSFDYNTAHFAILNTNDLNADGTLSDKQTEWLKADMAKSNKPWKFVALHKAPYSNGSHFDDEDVIALRAQLSVLMPELNIDVVFQGHDHVYLRTDVMNNNEVVKSEKQSLKYNGLEYTSKIKPDGTVYSINGTAGVKHYEPKAQEETDKLFPTAEKVMELQIPSYSYIQIDGGNLYFDTYAVENGNETRVDSFAISKVVKLPDGTEIDGTNNGKPIKDGTTNPGENDVTGDITDTSANSTLITAVIIATILLAVSATVTTVIIIKRRREEA